jgi:hypothetical protein
MSIRHALRGGAPVIVLAIAALGGCVHQPQNPDEFRQCINDGHGKRDSYTVNRPFDAVARTLKEKAEPGFSTRYDSTLMSGYQIEHSVVMFRCKVTAKEGRTELVIQKKNRPGALGATMPEGGWFWLVADIELVSAQETRVTTYGLTGLVSGKTGDALDAIKQWAQGNDVPAPALR